jgi:hypothetical protein
VTPDKIAQTRRNIRELMKVGEHVFQEVVMFCTRARRLFLNSMAPTKPSPHDLGSWRRPFISPDAFPTNWWIKWM